MNKLLECVPNISEGSNLEIIDAVADVVRNTKNVQLLNVDAGVSANRTVFTFAGEPQAVVDAAFMLIKTAARYIDMQTQTGEHPRMGATDVCPLIPISGISMDEAAAYALQLSQRVGSELGIPVYSYEYSSTQNHRMRLEQIRSGEYEGLAVKMQQPGWQPDFGPHTFNAKSGATVIGARKFLIAYNINLATTDVAVAKHIAATIRESGTTKIINGERTHCAGTFTHLKAIGWYMQQFGIAQVSTNITDFEITKIHAVYEAVKHEAQKLGTHVTGSELVGLIPTQALLEAGLYYASVLNLHSCTTDELFILAIKELGLNDVKPFDIETRILERILT